MTTIAYRDGVMAADSRAFAGRGCPSPGSKFKLHRLPDDHARFPNAIWGCSSSCVGADAWAQRWLLAGANGPHDERVFPGDFQVLLVEVNGDVWLARDNPDLSGPITTDFCAVGSGEDYAMGAMAMGAGAERAVEIAAQFDPFTGGEIYTLPFALI